MKLVELAAMMGISKEQLEVQLKQNDVIELKLTERAKKNTVDEGKIEVMH